MEKHKLSLVVTVDGSKLENTGPVDEWYSIGDVADAYADGAIVEGVVKHEGVVEDE